MKNHRVTNMEARGTGETIWQWSCTCGAAGGWRSSRARSRSVGQAHARRNKGGRVIDEPLDSANRGEYEGRPRSRERV